MNTQRIFRSAVIGVSVLVVGLSACGSDGGSSGTPDSTQGSSQVIGPVIADVSEVGGTTVQVSLTRLLVINADNPTTWSATVDDPSIVAFEAGKSEGGAEFNPGFTPLKVGSTMVTMTDGSTTATFTVEVID